MKKIVGLSLILSICFACQPGKKNTKPNIVIAHCLNEPRTLNPAIGQESTMLYVSEYLQKTLTRIDLRTLHQIPVLLTALPEMSSDSLHFKYHLRKDVKWDNGDPLTVEDVIFSAKTIKCPLLGSPHRDNYLHLKNIEKDPSDPQSFTMEAKDVYYLNPDIFDEVYIMQKKVWDSAGVLDKITMEQLDDEKFDAKNYPGLDKWVEYITNGDNGHLPSRIQGLGPYKLESWQNGSSISLVKKENYWGAADTSIYNKSYPDKIIFKFIPEMEAVSLALKKGNIDVVNSFAMEQLTALKNDTVFTNHYNYGLTPQYTYLYLAMNMKPGKNRLPFFTDQNVRRAMAYLTPVDELNKVIAYGSGIRQASFVQKANKDYYNDTLKLISADIDKASKLLDEAGWKDTDGDLVRDKVINGKKVQFAFKLSYPENSSTKNIVLIIEDFMAKAGIKLIPDPGDITSLQDKMMTHDFDMLSSAWSGSSLPENPAQLFHTSQWNAFNFTGFGDKYSDSLIDASNRITDPTKRAVVLKKLQALIYDEQPYVFLYSPQRKIVINKRFDNPGMYIERPGVILNALKLK